MANNSEEGSTLPRLKHALGSCVCRAEQTAPGISPRQSFEGFWCS